MNIRKISVPSNETVILRFSKKEYLMQMHDTGEIHCNSLSYYRNKEIEGLKGIFDQNEGLSYYDQNAVGGTISFSKSQTKLKITEPIRWFGKDSDFIKIFCLYQISGKRFAQYDPQKLSLEFGSHVLLIKEKAEFIKRVSNELMEQDIELMHGSVEYVDKNTHSGETTPLMKFNEYSYQNEYRLYFISSKEGKEIIHIGDMSDISDLMRVEDLKFEVTHTKAKR